MCLMCYDSFDSFDSFDSKILWVFDSCERTHAERSCSLPQLLASCYKLHHSTASSLDTVVASSELSNISPHLTCSELCRGISAFQYDQKRLCPRLTTFGLVPALKRWWRGKRWRSLSSGQPAVFILSSQFSAPHGHVGQVHQESKIDWRKYIKYAANNTR